jgi:hypothetical protein
VTTGDRWGEVDALIDAFDHAPPIQESLRAGHVELPRTDGPDDPSWEYEAFTWTADESPSAVIGPPSVIADPMVSSSWMLVDVPDARWTFRPDPAWTTWIRSCASDAPIYITADTEWRAFDVSVPRGGLRFDSYVLESYGIHTGTWTVRGPVAESEPVEQPVEFRWENSGLRQAYADICDDCEDQHANDQMHILWPVARTSCAGSVLALLPAASPREHRSPVEITGARNTRSVRRHERCRDQIGRSVFRVRGLERWSYRYDERQRCRPQRRQRG